MRRFTVMGFTEAELGFVLAAVFAGIAVQMLNDRDANAVDLDNLRGAAIARDSLAAEFRRYRDSVRVEMDHLRQSLKVLNVQSTKVPQCWERGEKAEPVADVLVLGANLFELGGETLPIDGVRERLKGYIERGTSLHCRYVVRARPTSGVDAVDQSDAVWKLRQHFDVNDRPR
jgi:hypothetical protein